MEEMRKLLLTLLLTAGATSGVYAAFTAADAFKNAPLEVFPLIDYTKRVEMIQLFEAGMAEKAAKNVLGGSTEILSMSDRAVTMKHATGANITIAILPMAKGDTAVMVLENLPTPAADANVKIYSRDWQPIDAAYTEPAVSDWVAKKSQSATVEETLPFMLAKGEWDTGSCTLTLFPTINQWIGEDSVKVSGMVRKDLRLKWNGKKFIIKR